MAGPLPVGPLEREPQPGGRRRPGTCPCAPRRIGRVSEFLYFAMRDRKIFISLAILATMLVIAVVGPRCATTGPRTTSDRLAQAPSSEYWFGTTAFGQDVFVQFVHGVGATFFVGFVGGGLAALVGMTVGFVAGYRGGLVDESSTCSPTSSSCIPTLHGPHRRRRLRGRARPARGGRLHRPHLVALGGARHPRPDALAAHPRVRRPGAALRPAPRARSSSARSRRT